MQRQIGRRGFLAASGGLGLAAALAACGGSSTSGSNKTTLATASTASTTGPRFDATTEAGDVQVFTWAGYDVPEIWQGYSDGPYGKTSPLQFQFLTNDQQALAKVASGYNPDIIHPCMSYVPTWKAGGLIQPWDTSLLPDFAGIPSAIAETGVTDGLQYGLPFDVGFQALTYRADKVPLDASKESWNVLLDAAYKGKIALFNDPVTLIKIGALINAGKPIDPSKLDTGQIAAALETMRQVKDNVRTLWESEIDVANDFANGNLWIAETWQSGYYTIATHPKMKDVPVRFMWPQEGRIAWVCGMVLNSQSTVPGRAHAAVAATDTSQVAAWLIDTYQYQSAQQQGVIDLVKNKKLIEAFSLNDPSAFAPPRSWFELPLPNRREYVTAGEELKAS